MYLRRTERRTKSGGGVGYLQLAHNVWEPKAKQSKVRVPDDSGRVDLRDRQAAVRLTGARPRALGPPWGAASWPKRP